MALNAPITPAMNNIRRMVFTRSLTVIPVYHKSILNLKSIFHFFNSFKKYAFIYFNIHFKLNFKFQIKNSRVPP